MDISTTGGLEAVGAVVRFRNGAELKSRYRRYRINTVEGQDDFAMLREVLRRRIARGLKEQDLPDLILVDGGKGQLSSALEALAEVPKIRVDLLSIEKGETRARAVSLRDGADDRVLMPGGETAPLMAGSAELHLLQRVRDEAHRFAIAYHRKRRGTSSLSSPAGPGGGTRRRAKEADPLLFRGIARVAGRLEGRDRPRAGRGVRARRTDSSRAARIVKFPSQVS